MNATRLWGSIASVAMLLVVAYPLVRDPVTGDSFPLSTYPMFAFKRPGARVAMDYVIATGPDAAGPSNLRKHVPPELIANHEVMQAMMTIRRAVSSGHAATLCAEVAARAARDHAFDRMDTIHVVFGDHRGVDYLVNDKRGTERTHARCAIPRAPAPAAAPAPPPAPERAP